MKHGILAIKKKVENSDYINMKASASSKQNKNHKEPIKTIHELGDF